MVDDSLAFLEMITELFDDLAKHTWEIHSRLSAADQALSQCLQLASGGAWRFWTLGCRRRTACELLGIINKRYPEC